MNENNCSVDCLVHGIKYHGLLIFLPFLFTNVTSNFIQHLLVALSDHLSQFGLCTLRYIYIYIKYAPVLHRQCCFYFSSVCLGTRWQWLIFVSVFTRLPMRRQPQFVDLYHTLCTHERHLHQILGTRHTYAQNSNFTERKNHQTKNIQNNNKGMQICKLFHSSDISTTAEQNTCLRLNNKLLIRL